MELQGTQGADTLTGGADSDTLYGYAGNDILKGGAGDDVLAGNEGADALQGGDGDDYLLGGPGADTIDGGAGGDWAAYEDATAAVKVDLNITIAQNTGGGGTDKLIGIEHVYGSAFNDTLTGNAEANMMVGGEGNDIVNGGKGDDTLWGSAGADTLDGGDGDDYLVGGAGDDIVKGGAGWDWSSYEDAAAGVTVDLNKTTAQNTGGGGTDTLIGVEHLYGTKFNDTLTGDANHNYLWGDAGDDSLYGGAGDDHLSGGAGNNWISGGDGFDTVDYAFSDVGVTINLQGSVPPIFSGPISYDVITSVEAAMGSAYDDVIIGNASENYLFGGAGDDVLQAMGGGDTLEAGDGEDYLFGSSSGAADLLLGGAGDDNVVIQGASATIDGGEGVDTLHVLSQSDLKIDLRVAGEQQVTTGLRLDVRGIENLTGSMGADILIGDAKDNVLLGGRGDDILDGGAGSDTVTYLDDGMLGWVTIDLGKSVQVLTDGRGTDTLISIENVIGTSGNDNITGNADANHLWGGDGNDWLYGVGGNDILEGGYGEDVLIATREGVSSDKLFGGAGNDRLVTNKSAATLDGGDGNDEFDVPHLANMAGTVMINGGAGTDTLDMRGAYGAIANLTIDLSIAGKQDVGQGQYLDVKGVENVWGGLGNDYLKGDAGGNLLQGGTGDDILDGGAGVDIASYDDYNFQTGVSIDLRNAVQNLGGRGTDTLISIEGVRGTAYDDVLIGDAKDNVFIGGAGEDYIDGGAGFDYVSYQNDGLATGMQVLLKEQWQSLISDRGHDNLISIEGVIGSNYDDFLSGNSGVNVLKGMDGDDGLSGYGGADRLEGGAGDDHLSAYVWQDNKISSQGTIMLGGDGRDTIELGRGDNHAEGGAGDDWFYFGNMEGQKEIDGGDGVDGVQFLYLIGAGIEYASGVKVDLSRTDTQTIATGVTATINSIEKITATHASDTIIGNANDNVLNGFGGGDVINGGDGNDTIYCMDGNDTISGDRGTDELWGGAGSDTFMFAVGDSMSANTMGVGVDVIGDFTSADEIRFVGKGQTMSFGRYEASDFASAQSLASTLVKAAAYTQLYMAFQVGADTYIFAGQNIDANAPGVENIIKLQGVSTGAISIDNFF